MDEKIALKGYEFRVLKKERVDRSNRSMTCMELRRIIRKAMKVRKKTSPPGRSIVIK